MVESADSLPRQPVPDSIVDMDSMLSIARAHTKENPPVEAIVRILDGESSKFQSTSSIKSIPPRKPAATHLKRLPVWWKFW